MIHAGAFYPGMRGPVTLIAALKQMNTASSLQCKLVVRCVGDDTTCYRDKVQTAGLASVLQFMLPVPFEECQRQISASHLMQIIDTPGYDGVFLPRSSLRPPRQDALPWR